MMITIKENLLTILLSISLIILLNACALYTPSHVNTPLFTEKGQLMASATAGTGENYQVAYAATNHIGIMANVFNYEISDFSSWDIDHKTISTKKLQNKGYANMHEIGIGYFKNRRESDKHADFRSIFEIFGGYGYGNSRLNPSYRYNFDSLTNSSFSADFQHKLPTHKLFVQPSFGITTNIVEMAFTPRVSFLNYGKASSNVPDSLLTFNNYNLINKNAYFFFEPTITFRLGYKNVKLHSQISASRLIGQRHFKDFNTGMNINVGMIIRLNTNRKRVLNPDNI